MGSSSRLVEYYQALADHFGPQHWWPAQTRWEVVVGAVLTQNTAWSNVERSLLNLRRARALTVAGMRRLSSQQWLELIRPSGFAQQKAATLQGILRLIDQEHGGRLARLLAQPPRILRDQLLALRGIGPETADCIVLYAAGQAVFVIDAYTRRIFERHGLGPARVRTRAYESWRAWAEAELPAEAPLYNEIHALLVSAGKHYCFKRAPDCTGCPLQSFLPRTRSLGSGKTAGNTHARLDPISTGGMNS